MNSCLLLGIAILGFIFTPLAHAPWWLEDIMLWSCTISILAVLEGVVDER